METRERILAHFAEQADWCEKLGSRFTAELIRSMAADFKAGGIVHDLVGGWPTNPRKDATSLRLTGALHHAVLTGAAPELATTYPSRTPDWLMAAVWPLARDWLASHTDHVRAFIESPPQTNETRRSIALLPGFLKLAARYDMPMHLLEIGASAGLNQNWDRFSYSTSEWQRLARPDNGVLISTDWSGPPPAHLDANVAIASRAACDLNPIDLFDPEHVLRLKCYIWPDQPERLARLDAAIRLAQETGVTVERADAADWLENKLANRPNGELTVIFHSVFLIYPPRDQIKHIMKLIADAGTDATPNRPLAWLCYESEGLFGGDRSDPAMYTRLQTWPGGEIRTLAKSDGHITRVEAPSHDQ